MSILPEPKREHPSTYFVQDRSNPEELARLQLQDTLITAGMGGVLPEQSDPRQFLHVLDVGCGTGGWVIELARALPMCRWLVGVDVSRTAVEYARAQAEAAHVSDRVEFLTMDALRMLEFPNHTFDLVNLRFGTSWLRTWDWPKLLQEMQRVARPEGLLRITEGEIGLESSSLTLTRLSSLSIHAFFQAGHLFCPQRDGLTQKLATLVTQHGMKQVQSRASTLTYHVNSPSWQSLCEDLRLGFQVITPFLRKWVRLPEDYLDLTRQAIREMHEPHFEATIKLLTVWGIPSLVEDWRR